MKSKIAREVLWLIVAVILAFPLSFVFLWLLDVTSSGSYPSEAEKDFVVELYIIGYLLSVIGIYFMRLVALLIRNAVSGSVAK